MCELLGVQPHPPHNRKGFFGTFWGSYFLSVSSPQTLTLMRWPDVTVRYYLRTWDPQSCVALASAHTRLPSTAPGTRSAESTWGHQGECVTQVVPRDPGDSVAHGVWLWSWPPPAPCQRPVADNGRQESGCGEDGWGAWRPFFLCLHTLLSSLPPV